jgi:glycosyltransferase involved in cell wall biosynthesis
MKISYLVDNNLETVGGEQESTKILINGALGHKWDVLLLQPGENCSFLSTDIQTKIISPDRLKKAIKNPLVFVCYVFGVFLNLRKFDPDVIHTQAQVSFFIVGFLRKLHFLSNDKIFIHTDRGIYSKYNRFYKMLFGFFVGQLSHLVCTTETNKKLWESALYKASKRIDISVISNTAGSKFTPCVKGRFTDSPKVGFSGRFCEWKNWPLAEKIVRGLASRFSGLEVKMAVGCLDEGAVTATKQMFSRIESLLGDRFRGDINVPPGRMPDFYKEVDYFILTSEPGAESFGRTVVEAMSAGCVVFVTDGGGPPEVIGNERFVFDSVEELIKEVTWIFHDKEVAQDISRRNIARANRLFSETANVERYLELYSSWFLWKR